MLCFNVDGAVGPLIRDIQIEDKVQTQYNIRVSSDVELVDSGGLPEHALVIAQATLLELRGSDIMPCECTKCRKPCKPTRCARCKKVAYCSTECQKADWKRHKGEGGCVELTGA